MSTLIEQQILARLDMIDKKLNAIIELLGVESEDLIVDKSLLEESQHKLLSNRESMKL